MVTDQQAYSVELGLMEQVVMEWLLLLLVELVE